jgi:hypothetical protein
MKKIIYTAIAILSMNFVFAQEIPTEPQPPKEPEAPEAPKGDTTRMKIGNIEIVNIKDSTFTVHRVKSSKCDREEESDTIDASPSEEEAEKNEAHWAGFDLGVNMLMNNQFQSSFPSHPYWVNDPAKSFNFSWNIMEHKFSLYKHYVGITTGLGLNFTQYGFKNNYVLTDSKDSIYAVLDTINHYSKNKLRASYLQIPLLLEFNTNADADKSFYLAAGLVGGLRMSSKTKKVIENGGKSIEQKTKGAYSLNAFKVDATVRMGYGDWGAYATYALIPIFETGKTVAVHPFTVGISRNF